MNQKEHICKIYSRSRFKIFKPKKDNFIKKPKAKLKIFYIEVIFVAIITLLVIYESIDPIFETICLDEAKSIATKITNDDSTKIIEKYNYNDLFSIERDENGNIQMIKANIFTIDLLTSDIASLIQEDLDNSKTSEVPISIGSFTGVKILSGVGPNIKIKISSSGNVTTDLRSEFIEKGINQTIHRIYLQIDCNVDILTPVKSIGSNISNQVLLAENVIIGQIPSTYYNLEGMENVKETLETIK